MQKFVWVSQIGILCGESRVWRYPFRVPKTLFEGTKIIYLTFNTYLVLFHFLHLCNTLVILVRNVSKRKKRFLFEPTLLENKQMQ